MEWTGELYGFYTNKPIDNVFKLFKIEINKIDYLFEYNSYKQTKFLLCYKNKEMLDYHLENGYNTDMNGEGCFGLEAKKVNLHGKASLFEYEGDRNFEPNNIDLYFDNIFYYVLVTPDLIESSPFSAKIYRLFMDVIKNG